MKKTGGVLNFKKLNIFKIFGSDKLSFFMMSAMTVGLLLGILLFSPKNNIAYISKFLFKYYIKYHASNSFLKVFFHSITTYLLLDFLLLLFGISAMGVVILPIYLSVLGFSFGGVLSYSYYNYSLKGIAINATLLIPVAILFFSGLLRASKAFFEVSLSLTQLIFSKGNSRSISNKFSDLFKRIILLFIFAVVVALIDSLLSSYMIKFFVLNGEVVV